MRIYHRYLGFFLAGVMAVYALSGIVLIFRKTDTFKKDISVQVAVEPQLGAEALGKALKIKELSFDKNFLGDFTLENNLIKKNEKNDLIYIGCQILNKSLFNECRVSNFSITKIWDNLRKENKLNGFQSKKKFYHLSNLDVFKKLKDL